MKEKLLKYLFFASSILLLPVMLALSRNAGISCDEVLHYNQSVSVYEYFASRGADRSALNTPVTHLKYYGQAYDNITTILMKWLNIDDVYSFRHYMSAFAGWLAVIVTALFAIWLSGMRAGLLVLFLFAVSPTFIGHSLNNLKDIPFALGYILSVFFTLKIMFQPRRETMTDVLLLVTGIGLTISIRSGGLLLICYLFLFLAIGAINSYIRSGRVDINEWGRKFILAIFISGAAFFLGILLWPFVLQHPLRNIFESLRIMAHFPDTFRQIFEGRTEWSDFMPWYYLPKSMLITIPLVVTGGFILFFIFSGKAFHSGKVLLYVMILFTVLFPILYAIIKKSNLYSSWRQFLFLYPPIVLLSATGFSYIFDIVRKRPWRWILLLILGLFAVHPVRYMENNHRYLYIYYNQLVGGLKGAFGNYETDYYYTGQTEASEWLINYLKEKNDTGKIKVGATYSVQWQFRNNPDIETFYMRNEDKCNYDWDYAIITNRYIPPYVLKTRKWPPYNAIHVIYADSVPICAVLKRMTKDDFYGYESMNVGDTGKAVGFYDEALKKNSTDEMIFFNFAGALLKDGQPGRADSLLREALKLNPDSDPVLMFLGNIAAEEHRNEDAEYYYGKVIGVNRKYYGAYVKLSDLVAPVDVERARKLLKDCLDINPLYKPAILALADTYKESDPDLAKRYYDIAEKIGN